MPGSPCTGRACSAPPTACANATLDTDTTRAATSDVSVRIYRGILVPKRFEEQRQQLVHLPERRLARRETFAKPARHQTIDHVAAAGDDVDGYVPRRALAGHRRCRLMVADHDQNEIAIVFPPHEPGERVEVVPDRFDVTGREVRPVGLTSIGADNVRTVVRFAGEHPPPVRLVGRGWPEGKMRADGRKEHEQRRAVS